MRRLRLLLLFAIFLTLAPVSAFAATAGATTVADPSSASTWRNWDLENSTENVGRIWTDKTVSDDNIDLTGAGGTMTTEKGDSDFLTSLSAISSTSNLTMTSSTPLDIVLVLDASGSMDDSMGNRDSTKRIDALKAAANAFVDEIAKANEGVSDANQQHRVAVVKFAGNGTERIGNDTYWSGGYKYNYSQRMLGLTACTQDGKGTITSRINAIEPAGATRADEGMSQAKKALDDNPRPGAKKVVVFFTDGTPTTSNEFSESVANRAVSTAKALKDGGTTIYTVGIQNGANPSVDPDSWGATKENKFLHAVSSNYPAATEYDELGARATDSDFYKTATNADDLKDVFSGISQDIVSAAGHPTDVVEGAENTSGYVTFTDQLGDYMKVDSFKSIVFARRVFSAPDVSRSDNVDTYTFHGTAGNVLYPTGDLADIVIRVERSDDARTGDKVTVSIPASLIPLRHFNIDEDAGTGDVTLTFPIRVFYGSSLKEEAIDLLANPDEAMADYIASHTDEDGKVYFLANAYSGGVVDGDTTSAFTPATGNSYYYITEDTPLYRDAECTQRARGPLSSSATYYYKRSWYDIADRKATKSSSVASFPGSVAEGVTGAIATDESGYLILRKGSRRLTYINEMHTDKDANATGTASSIINPHWSGRTINVALGNNGRISLEQPGTLAISKTVAVPAGFDEGYYNDLNFTFNISIPDAAGKTFKATVKGKDGTAHGDASWDLTLDAHGNATHTLKHGETLYVYGLPRGTAYTVTEEAANGFVTSPTVPQEGTIEAGLEAKAEFRNTYSAKGTLSGRENLAGEKILDGRDWLANDSFTFILQGLDGAPMPEGAEGNISRIVVTSPEGTPSGTPVAFNFGDIAYNAPGTYTYQIYEPAEEAATPGVSTSLALYTVTVTAEDNHDGTLAASAGITCDRDDLGAEVAAEAAATNVARFTNTFDATSQEWAPIATKTLHDASGALSLQPDMFEFSLTPMPGAPMPADATELVGNNNAHGVVVFEGITFTSEDVGKTYQYRISEKVPADPRPGMTYDDAVWIATVTVTHETVDGENLVKVSATYAREGESEGHGEAAFENSYTPEAFAESGIIKGEKQLVGRDMLDTDNFNFSLSLVSGPENGVVSDMPLNRVTNGNVVNLESGEMTFTKPGEYVFGIRENAPAEDGAGITWDRHVATATVTIVDNNGTLALRNVSYDNTTSAIDKDKGITDYAAFTNVYAPTEVAYYPGLTVSKVLTGRSMDMGMFSFTIKGKDATAETGTTAATADEANALLADSDKSFSNTQRRASGIAEDMAKLSDVVFSAENANKTYAFDVAEVIPADRDKIPGVSYDNCTHEVVVSVIDNLDGTLTVTTKIDGQVVSDDSRRVLFENTYHAEDATVATADFGLTKVLEGRDWQNGDSFTFLLEGVNGAPVPMGDDGAPSTEVAVSSNDATDGVAEIDFGSIVYTQPGQYEYKVTEKRGSAGGMTYSDNVAVLRITVRDNTETGKLEASVERVSGDGEFVNTYDSSIPSDQLVSPHFSKVLEGREWREGDKFTFTIIAKDGAPLPVNANGEEVTSVTVHDATEAADFTFGTIPFTYDMVRDGARTFVYEVREKASGISGISDDPHVATVTVTVADRGNGTMSAVVKNENNVFKNTYSSRLDYTAAGGLSVTKTMNGRAMSAGEFRFDVVANGDGDKLGIAGEHASSAAPDGDEALVVSSPTGVTFTQEDVGKVYSYTITEKGGNLGGVSYDATSYNVEITTDDDASNARLTVTTRVTSTSGIDNTYTYVAGSDANAAAKVSFENSYAAARTTTSIVGTKSMTNGLMFDNDFKFRLAYGAGDRAVVSNATNVNGKVDFGTLSYDSKILEGLVGKGLATRTGSTWTIPYVAYEVTDGLGDRGVTPTASSFPFNVTVTDNGKGTLTCTTNLPTGGPAFRNTYATGESVSIELAGSKLLNVDDGLAGADIAGKFKFTVTGYDGAPMPERTTATNGANGNVGFGLITFTFDDLLKALGETPGTTDEAAEALDAPTTNAPEATPDVQTGEPASAAENFSDGAEPEDAAPKAAPEAEGEAPVAPDATESAPAAEPALEALANHDVEGDATATASWRRSRRAMRVVSDTAETDGADEAGSEPVRERSHTYRYDITESGSADGVTNDTQSTRTVYVKVTDNGRGSLTAAIVDEHGNVLSGPAFTFTNSYSVTSTTSSVTDQIRVHKTLTGRTLDANEFTFELIEDGRVVATGTNDASGNVALSTIEYTAPGVHNYTIREHGYGTTANGVTYSDATYRVTTTVVDNGDGTLGVTHKLVDADEAEFENVYTAKPTKLALTAAKVLEGAVLKADQFTFKLSGGGVELTATNDANGQVTFSDLSFTQVGTYTFTISEVNDGQQGVTYDEPERKVTVTVKDDRQGNLIASVNQEELAACVFRNTYTNPEEPAKPTTPATPTKFVPQTGGPIESAPIVVSAVLGVAILAVALIVNKR
ncbi:type IV secretion protein Rhs [Parolsenella catena]|uniref:Type IV secretion protein Rhs n=1 Tax=Parolsenella catena TaxID=2003188 RepID=A0A3G9K4K5_9ACTN|nr:FctA domain-containing protein [Parolsenella catena]BBH49422.1 type IV secretion protein Rhs [Parolsenella catena]